MVDKVQLIKEEIERQIEFGKTKCQQSQENNDQESYIAWSEHIATCGKLLLFINSLPEEHNEVLEEEIENYINNHFSEGCDGGMLSDSEPNLGGVTYCDMTNIARHFAEWGRSHLPRVHHRDNLDEYAYQCAYDMSNDWALDNPTWKSVQTACKLGAEWQKQQMKEALQTEYEKGRFDMREEMMKDAVEGEVRKGYVGNQIVVSSKDGNAKYVAFDASYADAFCVGDKVKIIILKTE